MKNTILVTGGAGFIGSNFVLDWIDAEAATVINLDKLTYAGNPANLASLDGNLRHIFARGDIGDAELVGKLLAEHQPRAVVNFAAESHVDRSIHGPGEFIQTNIVGTFQLLEATRAYWGSLDEADKKTFRFLHVSTDEVYGSLAPEDPAFKETNTYEPNSPYSASKAALEFFTEGLYVELGKTNVRAHLFVPGTTASEFSADKPGNNAPFPSDPSTTSTSKEVAIALLSCLDTESFVTYAGEREAQTSAKRNADVNAWLANMRQVFTRM